jgi:uncharacterized membrane protein YfcA
LLSPSGVYGKLIAMTNLVFVLIGLLAGVLAGMFGIGGGVVIVPALVLLVRFSPQLATGTSLGALLLPVGALGAWAYYKEGHVRIGPALWIGLGLFFGAYVGARVAQGMSELALRRSFSIFLVVVAAKMWFSKG